MRLIGDFNRTFEMPSGRDGEDAIMLMPQQSSLDDDATQQDWPPEVDLILSAMEAARPRGRHDRRNNDRKCVRILASLRLFAHSPLEEPVTLYARDLHDRGLGFITRQRLPLGYGGIIRLTLPDGSPAQTHCTVYRCRETINGWFEGAVHFTVAQPTGCEHVPMRLVDDDS